MVWKTPPVIKVYEALGAIADKRVEQFSKSNARVYSSSGNKHYVVTYDAGKQSIMANDNGSYWQGYLGYPSIAFLLLQGVLPLEQKYSIVLKGIAWKDLNVRFKNDFKKTKQYVDHRLMAENVDLDEFARYCTKVLKRIESLQLKQMGERTIPPEGY